MSGASATSQAYPVFGWSHSRDQLLEECARAYYWRYYGSHNGWLPDAPEDTQLAWRLKHLVTLHTVFGQALHRCARDCAMAARHGRPLPTAPEVETQIRLALRAACAASRERAAFLRDPRRFPMLHSVFYRGEFDEAEVEAVREKITVCATNLCASMIWEEVAALPMNSVVQVDLLDHLDEPGVRVYAAPDLVTYTRDGLCTLIDWKSGRRTGDETALAQLALYAWFVERKLGIPFREEKWTGRAVYLQTGEEERYSLTRLDLMRAEHRIRESTEVMRRLLADPDVNRPLGVEAFELIHPAFRFICDRCAFNAICSPHLTPDRATPAGTCRH